MQFRMQVASAMALATMLVAGPASAGSYPFTLHNHTGRDIVGVSVRGGEVIGFTRVFSTTRKTFTIELPDGQCVTPRIRIRMSDGGFNDTVNYNACIGDGLSIVSRF